MTTLAQPINFQTTFAHFSATEIVGQGGAGIVYRATDDQGQVVAVKALDAGRASRDKVKRFKNELLFCVRNRHKNIITVIDHGVCPGKPPRPFYVMPYYTHSLRSLIQKGISSDKALKYFSQLLDGVEAAHLQKVIHRDLKPENILCHSVDNDLVIADFGIARFEEDELLTLVETGPTDRLANFQYSAPEQRVRGGTIDHRADIYALGLILSEMLTGQVSQGTGYKRIADVVKDVAYLDAIVDKMIRQLPSERFSTIEEIKESLIARRNDFISRQRLSALKGTVIPVTELDDPLIDDPIRIISGSWENGTLSLKLNRPVNDTWLWALRNMGGYTSLINLGPEGWHFAGNIAKAAVSDVDAQRAIDYFKNWLPRIHDAYGRRVRTDKREEEERKRNELERRMEEEERRLRTNSSLRF